MKHNKVQICFVAGRVIDGLIESIHKGHSAHYELSQLASYVPKKFRREVNLLKKQLRSGTKIDAATTAHSLHRKMVGFCMGRAAR